MDGATHWTQPCSPHDAAASANPTAADTTAASSPHRGASTLPAPAPAPPTRRLLPISVMRPTFLPGLSNARTALLSVCASPADANYVLASSAELGAAMYSVLEAGRAVARFRPSGPTCTRAALFGSGSSYAFGSTAGELYMGSVGQAQKLPHPGPAVDGLAAVSDVRVFPAVSGRRGGHRGTAIVVALTDGSVVAVPELPVPERKGAAPVKPLAAMHDALGTDGQALLHIPSTGSTSSTGKAVGAKKGKEVFWRLHDLPRLVLAGPSPNMACLARGGDARPDEESQAAAKPTRQRRGRAASSGRRGRQRRPAWKDSLGEEADADEEDDEAFEEEEDNEEGEHANEDGAGSDATAEGAQGEAGSLVPSMLWRRSALSVAGAVVGAGEETSQVVVAGFGDRTLTLWFLDPL